MKRGLFGGFPGGRFIGKDELNEVVKVIKARSPYRFYGLDLKKYAERLEAAGCNIFSRRYALAVSSGTAALHTALFSLGIKSGDEVIIPAYAWSANLMSVLALGAVPVIAPIDETLGLDIASLERCISSKTKAIVAVHMRGYPCDLKNIVAVAKRHRLRVIEDSSQCIGGSIADRPVGAMGDVSVMSFQYNKLITAGEGGMFLTDDNALYQKGRLFHDLGMLRQAGKPDPEGLRIIKSKGLNYRLSELQAAFLIAQLAKMPKILKRLEKSYRLAKDELSGICQRFGIVERGLPSNAKPNHAFLCLKTYGEREAKSVYKALRRLKVPFERCSRLDSHHFETWRNFMVRQRIRFRSLVGKETGKILRRCIYLEINAAYPKR